MKTVDIKGNPYVMVNERVKVFRSDYKGSIETEIVSLENGVCTMKAIIKDEEGNVIATGHAQEKETSSFINKTSYIENCETSAIGRALGFVGIGIDASIASAEEVMNAINNQGSEDDVKENAKKNIFDLPQNEIDNLNKTITKEQARTLAQIGKTMGWDTDKLLDYFKVDGLLKVTNGQYGKFMREEHMGEK